MNSNVLEIVYFLFFAAFSALVFFAVHRLYNRKRRKMLIGFLEGVEERYYLPRVETSYRIGVPHEVGDQYLLIPFEIEGERYRDLGKKRQKYVLTNLGVVIREFYSGADVSYKIVGYPASDMSFFKVEVNE
jgi:hypothetical protein